MASPAEFTLADLRAKYEAQASSEAYSRLYEDGDEFGHIFQRPAQATEPALR